jgi:transcriptional regulator with XRE-family HTH domain
MHATARPLRQIEDFSKATHTLNKALLSKLERGERNDTRLSTAIRLSNALKIALADLADSSPK